MADVINLNTIEELRVTLGADFIQILINTYCEETPILLTQLQQAIKQQDAETMQRVAHSIKSTSASLGALELAAQAHQLEIQARDRNLAGVDQKLASLEAMYSQVARELKGLGE